MRYFILTAVVPMLFLLNVNADTVFIDQLDLSKTTCGWKQTAAKKSVDGNPLIIAGRKFERGIGHHAPGNIICTLPKSQGKFTAWVGIDDETGKRGHAEFLVYLDRKEVWRSGFMSGGQEAKLCEVPFQADDRHIRLAVVTGPEGFSFDHTDWADAKIECCSGETAGIKTVRSTPDGNIIDRNDEVACEYLALTQELKAGITPQRAAQALRPESTFLTTDRDPVDVVLRRTKALLDYLKTLAGAPKFEEETKTLQTFIDANVPISLSLEGTAILFSEERKKLFAEIVALRNKIALQNPLIDFQNILFIKRHYTPEPEKQGNHMVDQFFGFHAVPGGGLYVLENAFDTAKQSVRNILAGSIVENGQRLKGENLDSSHWGFLAPELSFDGTKILFAAAETSQQRHSYQWTKGNCYHLFEVNTDGSHLVQLTDGQWNDIDPCYLPSGRIAFISERRGGYGRCHGRPCPSYTLHSMLPDGSDIVMLSPHETNEWAPAVDHNGMIVYTRWDYVDRGFNNAHHPWITTPDGRDPRAIQGNYSEMERARPHFETSLRPIPGSPKFIGTAQGHHSQYFGSIILFDPNVPDDEEGGDPMAPLRRVTPEQLFPEVENRAHQDAQNYGQPFPMSEDFYLVAYDPFSKMNKGHANNYGIYLLDSFGNKTLLYRDPDISCQCPIALKPRSVPPVIPHRTLVGLPPGHSASVRAEDLPKTGTVGVTNVYSTNRRFPEGTKIKELRVVQILPKTTPNNNSPRIGYGEETGARKVLGTVPVETDGSVRFELPVNVPVYFQVLDESGVAVQTMRSATYVKPGETLTCLGCHEGRHHGTALPMTSPAAFRKEPAAIQPDVEGSNPFSFPRLIQPILDKHCVDCHEKESQSGKTFRLGRAEARGPKGGKELYSESYVHLENFVFMIRNVPTPGASLNSWSPARTFPGKFGSNQSPLWHLLKKGHYDVRLSPQESRAFALWMDNNADFYGAFEFDTLPAQRNGECVQPALE